MPISSTLSLRKLKIRFDYFIVGSLIFALSCSPPTNPNASQLKTTRSPTILNGATYTGSLDISGHVMFSTNEGICTGELVSNSWMVSARHCTNVPGYVAITLNSSIQMGSQSRTVAQIVAHPDPTIDLVMVRANQPFYMIPDGRTGSTFPTGYWRRVVQEPNVPDQTKVTCYGYGENAIIDDSGGGSGFGTLRYAVLPERYQPANAPLSYFPFPTIQTQAVTLPDNSIQIQDSGDSGGVCLYYDTSSSSAYCNSGCIAGVLISCYCANGLNTSPPTCDTPPTYCSLIAGDFIYSWIYGVANNPPQGSATLFSSGTVSGYALDPDSVPNIVTVFIYIDGNMIANVVANGNNTALPEPNYQFSWAIPQVYLSPETHNLLVQIVDPQYSAVTVTLLNTLFNGSTLGNFPTPNYPLIWGAMEILLW
jgi:Trypsin